MDSNEAIDNVKEMVKVTYGGTCTPYSMPSGSIYPTTWSRTWDNKGNTSTVWTSAGAGITIEKVEFKEPALQRIYDKIIKLLELVENNTDQFSDDLEYALRMRNRFVENNGYIKSESMVRLNTLWKKYK